MKISSVCRSGRSCSCHQPCAGGITAGQRLCVCACVCRCMNTFKQLQCVCIYSSYKRKSLCVSVFVPRCMRVFPCVSLGQHVQWVGQVRPACQRVEHLWRPCHPRAPRSAPKQEDWEGGQARRAVPKLSLFITATETGRGRQVARPLVLTYCDHLLFHSVYVCLCGWVGVQVC